ncbi:pH-response transcription factor pacc-1 [Podospora bellae-mahoneyi]|uniref:PH-response transcription factor pacC/RIM101 n=2 Tax=Podospora TaxID=5144 RepID=A0A090CX11_PODAN|nr:pH-response transcription factor pacc-1 [Podospora bellae-mahoneyi]CDP32434.1 Putative pH-response transcription factor pacC/RIM101 [Podospora anserina S mat+]
MSSSGISPTQVSPTAPAADTTTAAAATPAAAAAAPSSGSSSSTSNGATPAPSTAPTASSSSSTAQDESLVCRWSECNERFTSAEVLYEHICEKHVGRKSTNNLNLTCQWNACRTTTVKRDHITSHIRVHVPLKPHKCDFCGKSFKRPQDLKKHVKTHADDSVLVGRTQDQPGGMNPAYRAHPNSKAPPAFYDHNGHMRGTNTGPFGHPHQQNGQPSYYGQHPAAPQHPSYHAGPPMYYSQHMGAPRGDFMSHHASSYADPREKRQLDNLNELFGNLKRRQIDPSSYQQVGRSLMPIHGLGFQAGGGVATEYMAQAPHTLAMGGGSHATPLTQHYYLPPMPNLRTKEDLTQIDQMLEQMQHTVYENTGSPNSHYAPVDLRHPSPSYAARPAVDPYAASGAQQVVSPLSAAPSHSSSGTPAVTPPSSNMSYTSGHSPTTSSSGMSPISRHSSTSVAYPNLSSRANPLPYPPTAAGLGSNFTHNERRLSGGMLQAAARRSGSESDGARTPTAAQPGASSVSSPSGDSEGPDGETYDDWLNNMRTIEALRSAIRQRLERRDYEEDTDNSRIDPALADRSRPSPPTDPGRVTYPVLPPAGH